MRILVYMPTSHGGIADYAHDQCNALQELGVEVECLCAPGYAVGREARYRLLTELEELFPKRSNSLRILRRLRLSYRILRNASRLVEVIERGRHEYVLMHFSEYFAPFWAPRLRRLNAKGVIFGTVLHDPVRDYIVGPRLWHEWSVREGFSFVSHVFVHSQQEAPIWTGARQVVVPYGIHPFPEPDRNRAAVRKALELPDNAKVLLAFGFIRNNKNLDLVLRAVADIPELYLLVAGPDQAGGNKPASHYQTLAEELGCADRCRWLIRYIRGGEMGDVHAASDLSVLTYSRSFTSASSALSATTNYRLPCIASSGPGSLESLVKRYKLGIWVEPDSTDAIGDGLRNWLDVGAAPDWERYLTENSWTENARRVISEMSSARVRMRSNRRLESY